MTNSERERAEFEKVANEAENQRLDLDIHSYIGFVIIKNQVGMSTDPLCFYTFEYPLAHHAIKAVQFLQEGDNGDILSKIRVLFLENAPENYQWINILGGSGFFDFREEDVYVISLILEKLLTMTNQSGRFIRDNELRSKPFCTEEFLNNIPKITSEELIARIKMEDPHEFILYLFDQLSAEYPKKFPNFKEFRESRRAAGK